MKICKQINKNMRIIFDQEDDAWAKKYYALEYRVVYRPKYFFGLIIGKRKEVWKSAERIWDYKRKEIEEPIGQYLTNKRLASKTYKQEYKQHLKYPCEVV